jgi:hypothetical protein
MDELNVVTATVCVALLAALVLAAWVLGGVRLDVVRRRDEEAGG